MSGVIGPTFLPVNSENEDFWKNLQAADFKGNIPGTFFEACPLAHFPRRKSCPDGQNSPEKTPSTLLGQKPPGA
ncbi:UNVERIFIED_ORG: hypothetical protein LHK14_05300 [Roseateles sp. XES5]|nr:hypothetical protein [Roseateles sp. XES5]